MRSLTLRAAAALRLPMLALATIAVAYLAWLGFDGTVAGFERLRLPELSDASLGDRVLVIAPHPDDETLAAGGLISRSMQAHKHVLVVVMTCGDGFRRIAPRYASATDTLSPFLRLGQIRAAESRAGTARLGLPPSGVVFLGYPDGAMSALWNGGWDSRASMGVNGSSAVPYSFAFRPGAAYDGASVASDLASIVTSFAPSAVVYPDAEDANADHWAVAAFTQYTLERTGFRGARYSYLVHRGHFPFPWSYVPSGWMEPPRALRRLDQTWLGYLLQPSDRHTKALALDAYVSQRRAMEPFLAAFVRRNELFARTALPVSRVETAAPDLAAKEMPGVVVRDPTADTLLGRVDAGGDLSRVALVRGREWSWLGVEANASIAPGLTYRLSSRILRSDGSSCRLDFEVEQHRLHTIDGGKDAPASQASLSVKGSRIWIRVPSSVFDGSHVAMFAAEAVQGGLVLDRTAWRPVQLR